MRGAAGARPKRLVSARAVARPFSGHLDKSPSPGRSTGRVAIASLYREEERETIRASSTAIDGNSAPPVYYHSNLTFCFMPMPVNMSPLSFGIGRFSTSTLGVPNQKSFGLRWHYRSSSKSSLTWQLGSFCTIYELASIVFCGSSLGRE